METVDKPFALMTCEGKAREDSGRYAAMFGRAYHIITGEMTMRGLTKEQADEYEIGKQYSFDLPQGDRCEARS